MSNPANLPTVATLALLRVIPAAAADQYGCIYLEGYATLNDGGQGVWVWSSSSTATDNTGTIVNPTGNGGNGRWLRQFTGPLIDLWFGVVADGTTDNTTALQNVENAANALSLPIYYPTQPKERVISGSLTTYAGIRHFGDGINMVGFSQGVLSGYPGSHIYMKTGTTPVFVFQASTGVVTALSAPSWSNMNISNNGGGGIVLNSAAGGFTDDLTSQAAQENFICENVFFYLGGGVSQAIGIYKVFNSKISGCFMSGGTYNILAQGSDNLEITRNNFENATTYELNAIAAGTTFGNMVWIRDNVFSAPIAGASGQVSSTYRQIFIEDNFFEPETGITVGNIVLGSGFSFKVTGNDFSESGAVPNWLVVTGVWANITISGNTTVAGTLPPALFNNGLGLQALDSSGHATIMNIGQNYERNSGIPFATTFLGPVSEGPPISGTPYWTFNPFNCVPAGTYSTSLMVTGNRYVIPALAGTASLVQFNSAFLNPVTDTVDVWVCAWSPVNTQTLSVVFGGVTYTQALGTNPDNPGWYKVVSAVAVVAVTSIQVYNADTVNGGVANVYQIKVVKH